jgi:Flp pilus assembly protein TadG
MEFAMLALPFCLLIFAILESCVSFAAQQLLSNAVDDVARAVRTGQLTEVSQTVLHNRICAKMELMVADNCPNLQVDMRTYPTFQQAAEDTFSIVNGKVVFDIGPDGNPVALKAERGAAGSKVTFRAFYMWPVMTDLMRASMSTVGGDKTLLYATTTWQNEQFD